MVSAIPLYFLTCCFLLWPNNYILQYDVAINNEKLADALTALPDDERDIVLLAYFLDMSDQEIADKLNMVRRTVQYRRTSSLKEMKQRLEVNEDGGQSEE